MAKTLSDWQFKNTHVQPNDVIDPVTGLQNFISAESIVLASGPSVYPGNTAGLLSIGLCDSVSVQQNRNLIQLFELGSKLPFIFPGRTFIQFSLNRVVFNGDSLLGVLNKAQAVPVTAEANDTDLPGYLTDTEGTVGVGSGSAFYMNLASTFFNKSFGLGMFIQDSDVNGDQASGVGQWVAGFYAENCMIQSHQMTVQGQQYIVMESAMVRCTNLRPIQIS
jgi:hypothetical protein